MHLGILIYPLLAIGLSSQPAIAQNICVAKTTRNQFEQPYCHKQGFRLFVERERLLKRLSRSQGKWEARHPRYRLLATLHGFVKHHELVSKDVDRWRSMYKNVPKHQRKMLERTIQYTKKLNENDHLLAKNKKIYDNIVKHAMQYYEISQTEFDAHIRTAEKEGRVPDKTSIGQALKHLIRDWSAEGDAEHDDSFPCIVSTLLKYSPANRTTPVDVLIPGSGLGRLGHDIHDLGGFRVTLNEYSASMITAYRYILSLPPTTQSSLHPFTDSWSNHASTSHMQRLVSIPSRTPMENVLLIEGDFTTAFLTTPASFDTIVTLFFIDTARNILSYFDTIHKLLRPGGTWINFGPLLYGSGPWVQLSLDEVVKVVEGMGFEFLEMGQECGERTFSGCKVREKMAGYGFDGRSLGVNAYRAQSWVVRKV